MNKPRTISIGGATFDLFVRMEKKYRCKGDMKNICFPIGEKLRVEDVIETCGGGASNTSVGFARLGCDAAFCGVVGSDQWGERLLDNLGKEGVDTASATVVEGEVSSSSIILSVSSGERTILYDAGTNAHLHPVTFDWENVSKRDWIYLNHLPGDSRPILTHLAEILESTKHPPRLAWNPGGPQIEAGIVGQANLRLLRTTSLLFLNREEALTFTREPSLSAAIAALREAGAGVVIVTDGKKGAVAADGTATYRCPIDASAPVIDTTGAGDAFGTGVTWAISTGLDLPTALRAGTINATSVLGFLGAQAGLLTDIEMKKRLRSVPLDVQVTRR